MKREFLINILFLVSINLLIKPIYLFGIDRVVQNILAPGIYGVYFEIWSLVYLFQIITDFGIQNYNNRQIAQHPQLLNKYFPSILSLKAVLSLIFAIVVFIASGVLGYLQNYPSLVGILVLNQILLSLLLFLRSNISGLGFYRTDSFLSILDKLLMILILGVVLWLGIGKANFQIHWFVLAQTVSFLIAIILALVIISRHLLQFRFRFQPKLLLVILRQSYPYALVILLMTLYTRIDAIMLGNLLSDGHLESDLYASAYRLLDAANMFGYLFATLLLPMFARLIKQKEEVSDLVRMGIQMIWAGAIPLAASLFFFQRPIMELLYVDADAYSGAILGWLILSFVAISGSYIYSTLLTANGSLRQMNQIFLAGVLLNILLNLFFIPQWKAEGAAIATLITQFFVFLAQVLLCIRLLNLKWDLVLLFRIISFASMATSISWMAIYLSTAEQWPLVFVTCLLVGLLLAFLFRMLDLKQLWVLLKNRDRNAT